MKVLKIISKSGVFSIGIGALSILFLGCGGGGGGGGVGGSDAGVSSQGYVGITKCYECHADGLIAKYASENIFSTWRGSSHGNYEGSNYAGNPAYSDLTSSSCNTCHDEIGDGELLSSYYLATGISFLGKVNRPLVGCESCHGSGDNHFGVGQIQYPTPGPDICGKCHDGVNHLTDYPESVSIYTNYQASPHAGSISATQYATGSTTDVKPLCSKCHTDEGAKKYKDNTAAYSAPDAALLTDPAVADANVVQCRTCHDAHDPGKLLKLAGSGTSAEYETCTNCHQTIDDNYHGKNNSDSWSGGVVGSGTLDTTMTIYDTHFDDASTTNIEGYNIDRSSDRSCRGCHNEHNADTTINKEWANSSHGGHILETTQDATTYKYNVTETEAPAYVHYDFKATNRQSCQRCHTATGFKNFANSPSTYNAASNDFSYLTSNQKEMMYCWACHTSNTGVLRDPGAFSNTSPYSAPSARITAVPDLKGSNICMCCHSGRLNGQFIKDYGTIAGQNFGTFNSHYLASAGIVFRTIGYEYAGLDYSDVIGFAHKLIGTTGGTDGNNGPCVGCHMMTDDDHPNHKWGPLEKDGSGVVTDIKVYTKVCSKCHGDKATLISTLNTRDTGYNDALDKLKTQLANKGIYYGSAHPYFYSNSGLTTAYTAWPNKDTLGTAFNYNLFKNIPKAYVHNREYTRKLIYDSIDFLDDGLFNNSVLTTIGAGDAYNYLNGTR